MPNFWATSRGVLAMSDLKALNGMKVVTKLSLDKASQVFSKMIKGGARIEAEEFGEVDISEVTAQMNAKDYEVIASLIDLQGDAPCKFLFMVKVADCFFLTDKILRREPGTTKDVDIYVQSSIQELGNIMASAITNVFSFNFAIKLMPSPPSMMMDFAGTVFQESLMTMENLTDKIFSIEAKFNIVGSEVRCSLFLLPDLEAKEKLTKMVLQA